jgi:hypothetical protein
MRIRGVRSVAVIGLVVGLISAGARADASKELAEVSADLAGMLGIYASGYGAYIPLPRPPRFAFTEYGAHVAPKTLAELRLVFIGAGMRAQDPQVGLAADKKSAWIAAVLEDQVIGCGMAPCPTSPMPEPDRRHVTALAEKVGDDWQITASHAAMIVTGKQQQRALKQGVMPNVLERSVAGAEDVVKQLESTLGDPKRLAASVSARKDVVLLGSEPDEQTTGGEAVRAQLLAWNLAFKVRDGIVAGKTATKTVAFVAANVDATLPARPKDKPMPYRMLVIYEKTGAAWQIVLAHFSVVISPDLL